MVAILLLAERKFLLRFPRLAFGLLIRFISCLTTFTTCTNDAFLNFKLGDNRWQSRAFCNDDPALPIIAAI